MKKTVFILILLLQACSSIHNATCPTITKLQPKELEALNQIVLNNEFLSGCTSELVSDLKETECKECNNQCDNFEQTMSYAQWLAIYSACIVK